MEKYRIPEMTVEEMVPSDILCQSSLTDIGKGSLILNGNEGFDPSASGDNFTWGN